jgi:hypothetical protein
MESAKPDDPTPLSNIAPPAAIPPSESIFDAAQGLNKLSEQRPGTSSDISIALGLGGNPIHQKVNETHITQAMNLAIQTNQNDFKLKDKQQDIESRQAIIDRCFESIVLIGLIATIVFVVEIFKSQPTILTPILTGIGGLFAGFLAGIGYGKKGQSK